MYGNDSGLTDLALLTILKDALPPASKNIKVIVVRYKNIFVKALQNLFQ